MSAAGSRDASVVVERNLLIPLADGVQLAADLYRPAGSGRWPAIIDFLPYHKDGRGGRLDVEAVNRHFAARGYAALTIDLRGLGSSGGVNRLPFDPQEARDGHDAVEWVAAQPWCDGQVGMWGVSYGGITALAVAATRPPHLRAIVPIHACADIYHDFVAPGGCRGGFWSHADWGPRMVAYNLTPPLLEDAGGRWARVWADRLEANGPWLFAWWDHPDYDKFWAARVIPVERIQVPTFNIGGWRDLYAEATVRDHARIPAPKRLLMGPWKHAFPDVALDAPAAGLHEIERWWDRWLRGQDPGAGAAPPPVTVYVQGDQAGWRTEPAWPPPRVRPATWHLGADGTLGPEPSAGGDVSITHVYDPTIGVASIAWDPWSTGLEPARPWDQSGDDARALAFTSAPLTAPLELLGSASAVLDVAPSAAELCVVAKLADVAPNGRSTMIAVGWLDLGLRDGPGPRKAVETGRRYRVTIPFRATAYRIAAGHRLRLTVACADFPRIWPTAAPAELRLHLQGSHVLLPVAAPEPAAAPAWGPLQPERLKSPADLGGAQRWETRRDLMADRVTLEGAKEEGVQLDGTSRLQGRHRYSATVASARPDLVRMESTTEIRIERPVAATLLVVNTVTTRHQVTVTATITVDGKPFWNRTWSRGLDGRADPGGPS
jgi:putative CocE/NonD family hydrolase